jgi:hypothetical protein
VSSSHLPFWTNNDPTTHYALRALNEALLARSMAEPWATG